MSEHDAVAKHAERQRGTDMVLPTGEVYDLEEALEARWSVALEAYQRGDPQQLLALGEALGHARQLVYRIKERCDETVRDNLARRGERSLVSGAYQATTTSGTATYVDVVGMRSALIAAGMDADAANQFFKLEVTNGTQLKALAARSDAYAEVLAGHTKRGNPRVTYKRLK